MDDRRARGYRSVISTHEELHRRDLADGRAVLAQEVVPLPRVDAEACHKNLGRVDGLARRRAAGGARFPGPDGLLALAANNYAMSLVKLQHLKEARSLLRKTIPVARRVLGETHQITLKMRCGYARALYDDPGATLDDLREAVTTNEETARTARRVFGGAHPIAKGIEVELQEAQFALVARLEDTAPGGDVNAMCEAMAAMTADDA